MRVFGGTVLVLTAWLCAIGAVSTLSTSMIAAPAWADDGDGGDGDGGDGDGTVMMVAA